MKDLLRQIEKHLKASELKTLQTKRKQKQSRATVLTRVHSKRHAKVKAEARLNKLTISKLLDEIIDYYFSSVQKK